MKRRINKGSAEINPDEIEKIAGALSKCHSKPIQDTPVYLIQSDGSVEQIGQAWTCGYTHCRKPVKHGYDFKKFKNCPESFNQKTWDSLKEAGWVYRCERGGGLYVARNDAGEVLAIKHGLVPLPPPMPELSEKERAAQNAHQPDPVDADLEKSDSKHAAQIADMDEGNDAQFDEPFE